VIERCWFVVGSGIQHVKLSSTDTQKFSMGPSQ